MVFSIANIGRARPVGTLLAAVLLATACQPGSQAPPGPKASASGASATASPSPTPAVKHVFVIVLENTSYQRALAQPYIASVAKQYAVATSYRSVANPSLPNYLAMTSGSTWGIRDDRYHRLPAGGVGKQLTDAGISWSAYMEGFTGDCFNSPYPYVLKHNPFAYYGGGCPTNVVPMTDLATDLSGDTPQLSWITPGLCNDGHDCGVRTADRWLAQVVPQITSSPAWRQDGVLFITWDESSAGDSRVALLVVSPSLRGQIATAARPLLAVGDDQRSAGCATARGGATGRIAVEAIGGVITRATREDGWQYHLVVVETAAQTALQQTGVRLTPQRLAIAAVLAQTGKETSAQELYERVRKKHAYIGRATVFRSLDTLVSAGLAQRLERPGHISAYVWCEPGHHHHLICTTCRTVEDLGEDAVAPLADSIARQRGFRVDHATLDFYGECRACSSRHGRTRPVARRATAPLSSRARI